MLQPEIAVRSKHLIDNRPLGVFSVLLSLWVPADAEHVSVLWPIIYASAVAVSACNRKPDIT